jgi:hypothetical protein
MKKVVLVIVAALMSLSFSFGQETGGSKRMVEASPAAQKLAGASSIVRFSVVSNNASGKKWIARLKQAGFFIHDEGLLLSKNFKATKGVTYNVVIYKGKLWSKNDRTSDNIKSRAAYASLAYPSLEIACLIREKISDKEIDAMGLSSIVIMHEPIKASKDMLYLVVHHDDFGSWLDTIHFSSGDLWDESCGFAFIE